jgi:hypothetical protein
MIARPHVLLTAALALLTLMGAALAQEAAAPAEKWESLFNGKDLTGWTPKIRGAELGENFQDTFRVEDGAITVSYENYEAFDARFGHLFYANPYENYRLRLEYRFYGPQCPGGEGWAFRNSGIMVHGQPPETMEKDQNFPVSIEVQLLGQEEGAGERSTGNLCTPGTHVVIDGNLERKHCTNSTSETFAGDDWVTCEVISDHGTITHLINGVKVLEYSEPQLDPNDKDARRLIDAGHPLMLTGGTISLQSESHAVQFRNIEILELD